MPAYGSQIIPQVQQVGDPRIPKADMTVANNVASQGAAGLAAFTQMAAMGQRAQLEREQLAQQGALAMEGFAIRRQENAEEYGYKRDALAQDSVMKREAFANARTLAELKRSWDVTDQREVDQHGANFMKFIAKHKVTDPDYAEKLAEAIDQNPRAQEIPWLREAIGNRASRYQTTQQVKEEAAFVKMKMLEGKLTGHEARAAREAELNAKEGKINAPYSQSEDIESVRGELNAMRALREMPPIMAPDRSGAAPSQPTTGGPKVGDVMKGYRFKGGNPADSASWEKVL